MTGTCSKCNLTVMKGIGRMTKAMSGNHKGVETAKTSSTGNETIENPRHHEDLGCLSTASSSGTEEIATGGKMITKPTAESGQ